MQQADQALACTTGPARQSHSSVVSDNENTARETSPILAALTHCRAVACTVTAQAVDTVSSIMRYLCLHSRCLHKSATLVVKDVDNAVSPCQCHSRLMTRQVVVFTAGKKADAWNLVYHTSVSLHGASK